jgi:hypothetical protein
MADSIATPLQLWAGVGMYAGNAITANTALANNIAAYNALAHSQFIATPLGWLPAMLVLGITAGTTGQSQNHWCQCEWQLLSGLGRQCAQQCVMDCGQCRLCHQHNHSSQHLSWWRRLWKICTGIWRGTRLYQSHQWYHQQCSQCQQ